MANEESEMSTFSELSSDVSFQDFLSRGLPSRLSEIEDRPLERQDFSAFQVDIEKCLLSVEQLCDTESLPVAKWPLVALLFAHEHTNAPYTTPASRRIANRVLASVEVSREIADRVFDFIKPRLSRENWKFYTAEKYILISLCQLFPTPELQLPPILNICDSHLIENKVIGAQCLLHLTPVFTHDEEFGGRADIMIDQLLKLSYAHNDSSVLTVVYEALENLLLKSGVCHARRSPILLHLLRQCGMAISSKEKVFLGEVLMRFMRDLGCAFEEYAQAVLDLVEAWVDGSATRIVALCVLQCALSSGTISRSWERAAQILMSCAARTKRANEEEVAAILLCRRSLKEIRSYPESSDESTLFDAIR